MNTYDKRERVNHWLDGRRGIHMPLDEVTIGECRLILGDCLDEIPIVADAVITDPPYGMEWSFTGQGSGKNARGGKNSITKGQRILGDNEAFDPTPWLTFPRVVLWGFHHYPKHLTRGTVLVWVKKYQDAWGTFLSDADVAWMKGGCGVYLSQTINPAKFQKEKLHPTQKPVELMAWCMERAKVPKGATVLDPYMGSASTGIACILTGRKFIGIEKDPVHFHSAVKRIKNKLAQLTLFTATSNHKMQRTANPQGSGTQLCFPVVPATSRRR